MRGRKDQPAIFIRLEPELKADVVEQASKPPFEGNESQFGRDALRTVTRLRRALGPRYELAISELLSDSNAEKVAA